MAPHLEQVFELESMAAEHLGQEEWLKLTGCIFGCFVWRCSWRAQAVCVQYRVGRRLLMFVGKRVREFSKVSGVVCFIYVRSKNSL